MRRTGHPPIFDRHSRNMRWFRVAVYLAILTLVGLVPAKPILAGINQWTSSGPLGGVVNALAVDPKTPTTIYAGTSEGVYKSIDGGASWSLTDVGSSIYDLAIDPLNPAIIYAAVCGGVYKTTNGGASWVYFNSGLPRNTNHCTALVNLAIDSQHTNILYTATDLYDSRTLTYTYGLYKSVDGGVNWSSASAGMPSDENIEDLVIDPATPTILYAATYKYQNYTSSGHVFKTTNGGASWISLAVSSASLSVDALAIDPKTPSILYLAADSSIYKTINGGASWQILASSIGRYAPLLRVDPAIPTTLYAADYSGISKSTDGGVSWSPIDNGRVNLSVYSLAFTPSATTVYAGTRGGVYASGNRGASWSLGIAGMNAVSINKLAADPLAGTTLYAAVNGGFTRSTDSGNTWSPVSSVLGSSYVYDLAVDPASPNTLYAATGNVSRSIDGGVTWTSTISSTNHSLYTLAIDPRTPTTLYAGSSFRGVYKSTDSATNWNPINAGLTITDISALAIDPVTPTTLYVAGYTSQNPITFKYFNSGVHKSIDAGASWSSASSGLPTDAYIRTLAIDPRTPTTLYAIVGSQAYRSVNGGANWVLISNLPSSSSNNLTIDPATPSTLYVLTGYAVYRSTDSGGSWHQLGDYLDSYINSLVVNPVNPAIVYAGTGRGVYSIQEQADRLIVNVPQFASARNAFGVEVYAIGPDGRIDGSFSDPVTLAIKPGTGAAGAALLGATSVQASGGVARFSISIDRPGSGFRLIASAGGLSGVISAPFDVFDPEVEPNDTISDADLNNQLTLDTAGRTTRTGTIFPTFPTANTWADADWYALPYVAGPSTRILPGATITISLTNMPADYDLALVSDPRVPLASNDDGTSLTNITDAGRIDAAGRATAIGQSDAIARINAIGGRVGPGSNQWFDLAGQVVALSTNRGSADETIQATLTKQSSYYILVYSGTGAADPVRPYRLEVSVQGGTAPPPITLAQPVTSVPGASNPDVRTVFLYNSARMAAKYSDETAAIDRLTQALAPGPNNTLMQNSSGVSIDLSDPVLGQGLLTQLYREWDGDPASVDKANQVAQQIWYVLDQAIAQYYPNTTDIALVGGDDIIPFYRVPDETLIGNESQYYQELLKTNALVATSPLSGSLAGRFLQTDDFYADRQPTEWRGRALYIPDLGIGRLVETPTEIMRYLDAYAAGNYTIAADQTTPGRASAALVSGYDFVSDQADAIRDQLGQYGFPNKGASTSTLGQELTLNLLNDDQWTLQDFENLWFHGQSMPYQLASLNGHFSHYAMGPADPNDPGLDAIGIDRGAAADAAYFKNALIYSIGCHAGLSASNAAFDPLAPDAAQLQTDFAEAILRQGGNWVGNTGFAFGDSKSIGYSEQLALLFTKGIGRKIMRADAYAGAQIGESLARAKRQYIQQMGPGGFGIADEKTITQMTLYGLPFIRVKVPNPSEPLYGDSFDPPAQDIPALIEDQLNVNRGLFTRVITVTNTFDSVNIGADQTIHVRSTVQDDFAGTTLLTSTDQMAPGRPVLPALTYDITLNATALDKHPEYHGYAEPRGVRLLSATSKPDIAFNPQVTTLVTQQIDLQQADPPMTIKGQWLPDLPYTFQRTAAMSGETSLYVDKLIISPAQFNASGSERGQLRQFEQMVFEVSYVDPATAPEDILPHPSTHSTCNHCRVRVPEPPCRPNCFDPSGQAQLSAEVTDYSRTGLKEVSATYTTDGKTWRRVLLQHITTDPTQPSLYQASVDAPPPDGNIYVFFEALDNAGNVTVSTSKGTNGAYTKNFLPLAFHQLPPDLVGSISLSPDNRAFQAGESVQINVTVTNNGEGDAGPFWADLFINPSVPPTAANTIWNQRCGMKPCFGLAWQVKEGLKAHASVTLTSQQLPPGYSIWPGWFAAGTTNLYLYVDSYNPGVAYGAVPESSESNNQFHLGGLTVAGKNPALFATQSVAELRDRPIR